MADLLNIKLGLSITIEYSRADMHCNVLFNGAPTSLYAERSHYDDPFRIYVDRYPDSPIFTEMKGWGVVGGISMLLDALTSSAE